MNKDRYPLTFLHIRFPQAYPRWVQRVWRDQLQNVLKSYGFTIMSICI